MGGVNRRILALKWGSAPPEAIALHSTCTQIARLSVISKIDKIFKRG